MGELNGFQLDAEGAINPEEWMKLTDDQGNPINLFETIKPQLTELQEALNSTDALEVNITPIFDFENLTTEKLQEALKEHPVALPVNIDTGTMTVDFTGLSTELDVASILAKLDSIKESIDSAGRDTVSGIGGLGDHMDSVSVGISRMRVYLDTGVLVGQIVPMIDRELYRRSTQASRSGTVS